MEKDRLTNLLKQASIAVGVPLSEHQAELFWHYLQELLEWNRKINLTAIKNPDDIIIKHFIDSLTPLPYLDYSGGLLDIGSGAGFPGIPLKIATPQRETLLVEPSRKKVSFLKHLIRTLGLKGIHAIQSRIEDMERLEPSFTILISRAFRPTESVIQLVSPLCKPGNAVVAMLGPATKDEQIRLQSHASAQNFQLSQLIVLELPFGRGSRTLMFFQKA